MILLYVSIVILAVILIWERNVYQNKEYKYKTKLRDVPRQIDEAVEKSLKRQRSVIKGQISEQLAPYLPEFPYEPSDAKFLGQPIDFIVFEGMSEGEVTKVIISDIKTGKSGLTKVQRQIRDTINRGDVEFHTTRIESIDGPIV